MLSPFPNHFLTINGSAWFSMDQHGSTWFNHVQPINTLPSAWNPSTPARQLHRMFPARFFRQGHDHIAHVLVEMRQLRHAMPSSSKNVDLMSIFYDLVSFN
jgi:hypothetical protein